MVFSFFLVNFAFFNFTLLEAASDGAERTKAVWWYGGDKRDFQDWNLLSSHPASGWINSDMDRARLRRHTWNKYLKYYTRHKKKWMLNCFQIFSLSIFFSLDFTFCMYGLVSLITLSGGTFAFEKGSCDNLCVSFLLTYFLFTSTRQNINYVIVFLEYYSPPVYVYEFSARRRTLMQIFQRSSLPPPWADDAEFMLHAREQRTILEFHWNSLFSSNVCARFSAALQPPHTHQENANKKLCTVQLCAR